MKDNKSNQFPVPYEGSEQYAFVCYAPQDEDEARKFIFLLQGYGCRIWFQPFRTEYNQDILVSHLSKATGFIMVLSKNSSKYEHCLDEAAFARSQNIPGCVLRLQNNCNETKGLMLTISSFLKLSRSDYYSDDSMTANLVRSEFANAFRDNNVPVVEPKPEYTVSKFKRIFCRTTVWITALSVIVCVISMAGYFLSDSLLEVNHSISAEHSKDNNQDDDSADEYTKGLRFSLSVDGLSYVVDRYNGLSADIIVPAKYKGLDVTQVQLQNISVPVNSITIPECVTSLRLIGPNHGTAMPKIFSKNPNLKLTINDNENLTDIEILFPLKMLTISGCRLLSKIRIASENADIDECDSMENVEILDIENCNLLKTIDIDVNVAWLRIIDCDLLTDVNIDSRIDDLKIFRCNAITSLYLPSSVKRASVDSCYSLEYIESEDADNLPNIKDCPLLVKD